MISCFSSHKINVCKLKPFQVSALNLSLPFPLHLGTSVADTLMNLGERDPWQSITPGVSCTSSPYFQSCVLRGVPQATKL